MSDEKTYSISEFAQLMKVTYNTVRYWANQGFIPGAYQQGDGIITLKRWRIPKEALDMKRPKRGRASKGGIIKSKVEGELRIELADLNRRHTEQVAKYAGLLGRYEKAESTIDYWQKLHDTMAEKFRNEVDSRIAHQDTAERNWKQREDYRRLYEDVLAQMNHKNEELKALAEEVRVLKEEVALWHEKIKSTSTQSTG